MNILSTKFIKYSIALIAFFAIAACDQQGQETGSNEFVVGVIAPMTGNAATYGRSVKQGVDMAVEEINSANLLGQPLKIIYEDDRMIARDGVSAFKRLVATGDVPVIIGPFGSSIVLAVAPVANSSKTVIISASATADSIADAGDYVFRITPPNYRQSEDIATFVKNVLEAKTAAIVFQNNEYGETLRTAFEKSFTVGGGAIVLQEGFAGGSTDFRSSLLKIKAKNPDVVFFPLHSQEATLLLRQAREVGVTPKFISADGAMTSELVKGAGPASEGVYFSTLSLGDGSSKELVDAFTKKYQTKYGTGEPDVYSAYYYEVTHIVASALKSVGSDAGKIKNYLYSLKGDNAYRGITGITDFDVNGEVMKPFKIYKVQNGKFVKQ